MPCPLACSDRGLASGGQPVAELDSCDSAKAASNSTQPLAVSIRGLLVQFGFDDPGFGMGCCPIHGWGDGARGGANSPQLESGIKCKKCGKGAKGGAQPGMGPGGKNGYVPGGQGSVMGRYIWGPGVNMEGLDGEDTLDSGELLLEAASASLTILGCISW